ncbi:integrin beta-nu [Vespa crabro]|uniref:integrin beta-nu n=1 Tax=Vespa crabro TaxID=7445 RepID=UPI001EFF742E|nr:integrin beta-nu [Vespa crabro]
MMYYSSYITLTIILMLTCIIVKCYVIEETELLRLCVPQNSCESCLEVNDACAWCSDWSYTNSTIGKPRCNLPKRLKEFGCPITEIRKAPSGYVEYILNEDFQDVSSDHLPVQLKPQRVHVKLRPNSKMEMNLQYRPAKNYPLDLYYLMDLTWSMKDDKDTLVGLSRKMTDTLGTFTDNFRLGFGSYADKPLMPFIFPGHENNPCRSEYATCAPLYSFKHHLPLTGDVDQFVRKVNNSDVTGNVDNLEGGLDGVIQAIVCEDIIGWGHQARKLMLLATDGYLHFAGEGKLGGAVNRQDFKCHLDKNGQYSLAKEYDYPSLAEISRLLQDHKVNLIFAVTEDRREEYELISDLLKEKARVATLAANSSNILEIIESSYHEIISKLVLRDNSTNPLKLEYFSNCGRDDSPIVNKAECNGIQEGQVYEFKVVFSMESCPRNESLWKQTVVIDDALASEASEIIVEVELLCGCNCKEQESSHCKNGVNECGICKCDPGWSGETCDCDESSWLVNRLQCIEFDGTNDACSGRGECICGRCSCDLGYKGQYCECSPCDKTDGIECGGRGTCECGTCNCIDGWKGDGCQCPSDNNLCIAPGSDEICGNHGYCDCGHCRCNTTAPDGLYYRGTFCESSASSGGSDLCVLYNSCVNATVEISQDAEKLCHTNTSFYQIQRVESVDTGNEHYCFIRTVKDRTTCIIPYIYHFNKDNTVTLMIADKSCRTSLHVALIPGIIFLAIMIMGIIGLCIWKCWIAIQDKREYVKFEQERQKTVYCLDENPLFKPATTRFNVPPLFNDN